MDHFKAQYLQVMQRQAPKLYRHLKATGKLMKEAEATSRTAERMRRSYLKEYPHPGPAEEQEAEARVRAELLDFRSSEITPEEDDEMVAMLGTRPILPPRGL